MSETSVGAAADDVLAGVVCATGFVDGAVASVLSKTPPAARTPNTIATETAPMIREKRFEARSLVMTRHPISAVRRGPEPALIPSLKVSVSALRLRRSAQRGPLARAAADPRAGLLPGAPAGPAGSE